jgi:clan AA aspartic protease
MGKIETEITLVNLEDEAYARSGFNSVEKVRKETVQALVDTGSMRLGITEELYQKLGLAQTDEVIVNFADGRKVLGKVTSGVIVHCKNRRTMVEAVVIPNAKRALLGVIPLEYMDLIVDPGNQTLVGAHGGEIMCMAY